MCRIKVPNNKSPEWVAVTLEKELFQCYCKPKPGLRESFVEFLKRLFRQAKGICAWFLQVDPDDQVILSLLPAIGSFFRSRFDHHLCGAAGIP